MTFSLYVLHNHMSIKNAIFIHLQQFSDCIFVNCAIQFWSFLKLSEKVQFFRRLMGFSCVSLLALQRKRYPHKEAACFFQGHKAATMIFDNSTTGIQPYAGTFPFGLVCACSIGDDENQIIWFSSVIYPDNCVRVCVFCQIGINIIQGSLQQMNRNLYLAGYR